MNRHGQRLTGFSINTDEILSLYKGTGGWMVLNAEYLNKSQTDETGRVFNHKLIIFDILVYDSNYLVGSTFESRVKLLDELYGNKECDKEYLYNISENVYRVKTYTENFENLFNNLIKIGMYEGLVFKRMSGKLEMGLRELNTCASQFKIRKGTKSYKY
jgi:ATP-dependent DNA ligase